jgi:hypothetical protein
MCMGQTDGRGYDWRAHAQAFSAHVLADWQGGDTTLSMGMSLGRAAEWRA